MLLSTEFKVQCSRTVPDGVVWTDVQTAYDATPCRDATLCLLFAHLRRGLLIITMNAGNADAGHLLVPGIMMPVLSFILNCLAYPSLYFTWGF